MSRDATPALPAFLGFDLELSAPCNARCNFCPQNWHGVRRRTPYLSDALVTKAAREIEEVFSAQRRQHERAQSMVGFCGMGEPLLRKDAIFRFLDAFGGQAELILVTNGFYLTDDVIRDERFGRLDRVVVSTAGWKEGYEAVYGIDFDRVQRNVLRAHERHGAKIGVSNLKAPEISDEDHRAAQAFWAEHGIRAGIPSLHSRGGHYSHPAAYPGATRDFKTCGIFERMNFVSSDGEVLSCCHDVVSDHVVGDLASEHLLDIIERKRSVQRGSDGFEICRKCTDFSLG